MAEVGSCGTPKAWSIGRDKVTLSRVNCNLSVLAISLADLAMPGMPMAMAMASCLKPDDVVGKQAMAGFFEARFEVGNELRNRLFVVASVLLYLGPQKRRRQEIRGRWSLSPVPRLYLSGGSQLDLAG